MVPPLFILLGTNLGDRLAMLAQARTLLAAGVGPIRRQSGICETTPWGVTNQPMYLNQVLEIETDLSPEAVLVQTQAIEQQLGRVRLEKWGSRLIDIDLLYQGPLVRQTESLILPHPLLHERQFALVPLVEIAPDFMHPVLQKTNRQLLAELADRPSGGWVAGQ